MPSLFQASVKIEDYSLEWTLFFSFLEPYRIPFDLPPQSFTESAKLAARRQTKSPAPRPQPIEYTEDRIRRQFFRDHPFEAFRPRSLIELDVIREEHPIQGKDWFRLSQHGRVPSSEESVYFFTHFLFSSFLALMANKAYSNITKYLFFVGSPRAIRFAANLHENFSMSISVAYHRAVAQFRSLRSEHYISTLFAINEAKFYGAQFAPNQLERGHTLTNRALRTWQNRGTGRRSERISLKGRFFDVWRGRTGATEYWSRGVGYTKRWQKGMPPGYWPTKEEREMAKVSRLTTQDQLPVAAAAQTVDYSRPRRDVTNPWKLQW
jgi:small subunit ribosomal protein S23